MMDWPTTFWEWVALSGGIALGAALVIIGIVGMVWLVSR